MSSFQMWRERTLTLDAGLNTLNLDPTANILKVLNQNMLGTPLYMSTSSDVNSNLFEERVERGSSSSLVRTRPLGAVYLFNPTGNPVTVTTIEISTEDISFIFNASNQVQISGVLTSDGLKAVELNLDGSRNLGVNVMSTVEVEVKNDTGNKIPVSDTTNGTKLDTIATNQQTIIDLLTQIEINTRPVTP